MLLENPFLRFVEKYYTYLIRVGSNLQSAFLFYMRALWGHQIFAIGLQKFHTIEQTASFFASLSIPSPLFHAYLVAGIETISGICLVLGIASRLVSIPLAIVMLTALSTAHVPALSDFKFLLYPHLLVQQAPYPYLLTSLLVLLFGPGRVSLDAWCKRWISKQPRF